VSQPPRRYVPPYPYQHPPTHHPSVLCNRALTIEPALLSSSFGRNQHKHNLLNQLKAVEEKENGLVKKKANILAGLAALNRADIKRDIEALLDKPADKYSSD
jgi:hypothetical protein